MNLSQKSISSGHFSRTVLTIYFKQSSSISIKPFKSQNEISGSIIQNSLACVFVFEFSLLNVGPKVYIFPNAAANVSPCNWPEPVI